MNNINIWSVKLVKDSTTKYETSQISNPKSANDIIQTILDLNSSTVEKFGILCLNTKNKVVGIHIIHVGNINSSIVDPKAVFQQAILNNASSIILFHNHPSGDPTPSPEDIATTKRLQDGGDILSIKVFDHIVVGDGCYVSLKEKGLM